MILGVDAFVLVLLVLVVVFILLAVKTVPQGYNYTIERFGRYTRSLTPGLAIIVPFIDRVGRKMNMMEQVVDVPSQEVITRDNATCTVDGVLFFQILDAAKASYEVSDLEIAILNLTMTNIRTVMGSMDLDQLLSQRDEINHRLLSVVDAATGPWGVKVTRIEIKDINPPRDLVDSMARQMKAERDKRAAILEAEGMRQSEVLRAEGAKLALILEAEGRKEAAFRDAEARERSAEAEARATTVVSDAVASGSVQALNYFVAQKYVAALQEFATSPNQKILMMPIEASALIGTLGGIAEIAREGFGGGGGEGGATGGDGSAKPRRPGGPRGGATSTPAASAAPRGSVPGIDPWKA
jgi:regulator of protease activity HflC (stomatin/prohibitin superfamily)